MNARRSGASRTRLAGPWRDAAGGTQGTQGTQGTRIDEENR
jgi:hypothetical protein